MDNEIDDKIDNQLLEKQWGFDKIDKLSKMPQFDQCNSNFCGLSQVHNCRDLQNEAMVS